MPSAVKHLYKYRANYIARSIEKKGLIKLITFSLQKTFSVYTTLQSYLYVLYARMMLALSKQEKTYWRNYNANKRYLGRQNILNKYSYISYLSTTKLKPNNNFFPLKKIWGSVANTNSRQTAEVTHDERNFKLVRRMEEVKWRWNPLRKIFRDFKIFKLDY